MADCGCVCRCSCGCCSGCGCRCSRGGCGCGCACECKSVKGVAVLANASQFKEWLCLRMQVSSRNATTRSIERIKNLNAPESAHDSFTLRMRCPASERNSPRGEVGILHLHRCLWHTRQHRWVPACAGREAAAFGIMPWSSADLRALEAHPVNSNKKSSLRDETQ
jgi:hypothetical protein